MPLYEYSCKNCGLVSEFNMKMSDPHPEHCPKCDGGPLNKLMSTTAFHLKGGGWYSQAYDGKSNTKPAAEKSAEGPEKVSKDSAKQDKKAEKTSPKTESKEGSKAKES